MRNHLRHQDVFQRTKLGKQMVELEDETERLIAQPVPPFHGQVVDAFTFQADLPPVRRIDGAEQMQQGALPRPGCADHAEELAGVHLQVQPLEHAHLHRILVVGLVHLRGGQ